MVYYSDTSEKNEKKTILNIQLLLQNARIITSDPLENTIGYAFEVAAHDMQTAIWIHLLASVSSGYSNPFPNTSVTDPQSPAGRHSIKVAGRGSTRTLSLL